MSIRHLIVAFIALILIHVQPESGRATELPRPDVYRLSPGANLQYQLQELLVRAIPGDVIEFSEGTFQLDRQIDLATDNITIRGQGADKTTISFKGQLSGGQGIEATGDNFVIEDIAIEDTAGNAIKVIGARNVTFRNVRVEWTGEARSSNGAYGLYPVQCRNVLIENCSAFGASDSGIYVGQSRQIIVRGCRVERNVAGIEIENSINADVYDNVATNNTGGLLVFDLPGLQLKAGSDVRLFRNRVVDNNHRNFAAPGNIVAMVPAGTGVMIMATDKVEVFDNDITGHHTSNVSIISYLISNKKIKDPTYDPFNKTVSIHDNRISKGGKKPGGQLGDVLPPALGLPIPDILFDGMVAPAKAANPTSNARSKISIYNNGEARFANFKLDQLSIESIQQGKYSASRDLAPHTTPQEPLAAVTLQPHDAPAPTASPAVIAYRAAPEKLSGYGLFEGTGSTQQPVDGVVPYTLNTKLFSDYTDKYRFIRVPAGSSIGYTDSGVLDFPEGTLIAKTFAYPIDERDPTAGERLLETRIEVLRNGEWFGYSYQWNDEQTEAHLLLGGGVLDVSWLRSDGSETTNRYEIPNANQCLNCHSQNNKYVPIGPTALNMNREFNFPTGTKNQLEHLASKHGIDGLPPIKDLDSMPVADDPTTGDLDRRAHAWLHVNCAHCHSPKGTARTSGLDLRYSQKNPAKFGLWKSPVAAGHGSGGREYDIVPGEPDKSILLFRIQSTDPSIRMPNVARNMVPNEATELIREWIAAMPDEK